MGFIRLVEIFNFIQILQNLLISVSLFYYNFLKTLQYTQWVTE